jgi:hypothetical protein
MGVEDVEGEGGWGGRGKQKGIRVRASERFGVLNDRMIIEATVLG